MRIELIVAVDEHWTMGKSGGIPWRLSKDFKHFKRTTMGHPMIMGRATFESIGSKPLPGRTSIVVTSQRDYVVPDGVLLAHNLDEAMAHASSAATEDACMIIGGSMIYRAFLPQAEIVHLTVVHHQFEGDTFFPALNLNAFEVVASTHHDVDERHLYPFTIFKLARIPGEDVFHRPEFER